MSDIARQNLLNDTEYLRNIMFITQNTEFEKANCILVSLLKIFLSTRTLVQIDGNLEEKQK